MRVKYLGNTFNIKLRTEKQQQYNQHMIPKIPVDTSKLCLSPMPGTLISVAVNVGDEVQAGQELAVVEAMKMQNILRAEKKGVVKAIAAGDGDILAIDQLIVEFE